MINVNLITEEFTCEAKPKERIIPKSDNMIIVSKEKWDSISDDYKGKWERWIKDNGWQPDLPEEFIGKRTVMSGCISNQLGALLTEGIHFIITE